MSSDAQKSAPSGAPEPEASKGRPLESASDGTRDNTEGPPSKRVKLDDESPATTSPKPKDGPERRKGLAPIKAEYLYPPASTLDIKTLNHESSANRNYS